MTDDNAGAKQPRPSPFSALPFAEWPKVLPRTDSDPILPLAIGISDDLLLRLDEAHWSQLRGALRFFCSGRRYLHALTTDGAMRCDVDGRPVEPVSEAAQLAATVRLLELTMHWSAPQQAKAIAEQAKAVVNKAVVSAAPVTAATPRVSQSGRPILSIKRAAS